MCCASCLLQQPSFSIITIIGHQLGCQPLYSKGVSPSANVYDKHFCNSKIIEKFKRQRARKERSQFSFLFDNDATYIQNNEPNSLKVWRHESYLVVCLVILKREFVLEPTCAISQQEWKRYSQYQYWLTINLYIKKLWIIKINLFKAVLQTRLAVQQLPLLLDRYSISWDKSDPFGSTLWLPRKCCQMSLLMEYFAEGSKSIIGELEKLHSAYH